ncbi:hypothetical protein TrispH2_009639 [Trichoplax sp. H2]|uniref:Uncharacterized protein n=1 Tax=Trichoplax adhaerens TaxID=10228 RepID=B3RW94_TRIAD|nr:predicted protein [Trichoplax adhaerens]EDV24652.1 predicted protein [Trichoplax adhaerens]RDD38248.1 hypothetical protein TrispH2_009639 [Trichoplax sp. H2]|eukprot:XP_002112542.1 predicted protein [Trichoplax adhaerens]
MQANHSNCIAILFNQATSEPVCMLLWSIANGNTQVLSNDTKFNFYLNDRREVSQALHQIRLDLMESCPAAVQNVYVVHHVTHEFARSMDLIINVTTNTANNRIIKKLLPPKTMVVQIDSPAIVYYMNTGHRFSILSWVDKMSHQVFIDCLQIQEKKKEQILLKNLGPNPRL